MHFSIHAEAARQYTYNVASMLLDSMAYRRAARRIRWIHRDDPLRRARSLRKLSAVFDSVQHPGAGWRDTRSGASRRSAPASDVVWALREFAQQVARELEGTTLRYSQRLRLLKDAERVGIRRFDANLIIAVVQERVQSSEIEPRESHDASHSRLSSVAAFVLLEVTILAGAGIVLLT